MAFDDGTPLDAAKLGALETKLNTIEANSLKWGSTSASNENASLGNALPAKQKQIIAGITENFVTMVPGEEKGLDITYQADSEPLAIILTPVKLSGDLKKNQFSYYVDGKPSRSNATVKCLLAKSATSSIGMRFYYMVICG